jgi:hypothetical protein
MQCDKSHAHKPWGHNLYSKDFSTREEAEYPEKLCAVMATILKRLRPPQHQRRSLTRQSLHGLS